MAIEHTTQEDQAAALVQQRETQRTQYRNKLRDWTHNTLQRHREHLCKTGKAQQVNKRALLGPCSGLEQCIIDAELPTLTPTLTQIVASSIKMDGERSEHIRTGLQLDAAGVCSVDVLGPDGSFLCRLNIFKWNDRPGGTVDIILNDDQIPTPIAWSEGRELLRQELPAGTLVTIDITKSEEHNALEP